MLFLWAGPSFVSFTLKIGVSCCLDNELSKAFIVVVLLFLNSLLETILQSISLFPIIITKHEGQISLFLGKQRFNNFISYISFPKKILKYVLHPKEGINQ